MKCPYCKQDLVRDISRQEEKFSNGYPMIDRFQGLNYVGKLEMKTLD